MTLDQTNNLNSALMVASCVFAFLLPVELFLFAYAVLGPLHYLTELSWLDGQAYYAGNKSWAWALALLCALVIVAGRIPTLSAFGVPVLTLAAFLAAYGMQRQDANWKTWAALSALVAAAAALWLAFPNTRSLGWAFATLLPTVIHVFAFTGSFLLVGALKSRSRSAFLSLAVFLACASSFAILRFPALRPLPFHEAYAWFADVNRWLLAAFGSAGSGTGIFASREGIAMMRFIAFAYTYHYLNWFSKTSVIKWHAVSKRRAWFIVAAWLAAVALYAWNYVAGLAVLLFLSLLHVFLEFPLNHRTFNAILQEIRRRTNQTRLPAMQ